MQSSDGAADRQTQTDATRFLREDVAELEELVKDVFTVLGGDARAVVLDQEKDPHSAEGDGDIDHAAVR